MTTQAKLRMARKLERRTLPPPKPDMTGWTSMERMDWEASHRSLQSIVREAQESTEPTPPEVWDAVDANDAAILAERAAKVAAERLAERPGSAALQVNARATRETADKARRAADEAQRLAEEAKRRPPPPPKPEPAPETKAPTESSPPTPQLEAKPKPKRQYKRREPGMPKPEKQWWQERAQWRHRSPEEEADLRRGHPLYQCLVDYDPIEWFKAEREGRDYDPDE